MPLSPAPFEALLAAGDPAALALATRVAAAGSAR